MVRRGSTVRVRQRAFWNREAAAKGGFLVAVMDTVDHLLRQEGLDVVSVISSIPWTALRKPHAGTANSSERLGPTCVQIGDRS
jgi:hypothetical protein